MRLTDVFIRRPVFAAVLSLLVLLVGLQAMTSLPLRQFPKMEQTIISINTTYFGANADVIKGFISTPIQRAVAQADGIDFILGSSSTGSSRISVYVKTEFDADTVFNDVTSKVASVRKQLPQEAEDPVVTKSTGSDDDASMYLSLTSKKMSNAEITDFATRVIQPKLSTISGVSSANLMGAKTFALRVWLDKDKMTSLGVTADEIVSALKQQNFQATPGQLRGLYTVTNVRIDTDIEVIDTFKNLVVRQDKGNLLRLEDVAKVELGVEDDEFSIMFNDKTSVFFGISVAAEANPLDVISQVRKTIPIMQADFPQDLQLHIAYDATEYIRQSISEVQRTIIEASIIVVLIMYLFLGSLRTVIVPMVTIPLSLIGVCSFLWAMGYSLNLLTLLAMVLAIGLVVDDAIVVVENIHRLIEKGKSPLQAALIGARQIIFPVIAMTITLAAVYTPIMLAGGLTGSLFPQFAFTLAMTVIISGFVALTLSPMMCSKLLTSHQQNNRFALFVERLLLAVQNSYQILLARVLQRKFLVVLFVVLAFVACGYLFTSIQQELAPQEDQSVLFVAGNASVYDNHNYMNKYVPELIKKLHQIPEMSQFFLVNGAFGGENSLFSGVILKPWAQRERSPQQIQFGLQKSIEEIPGLQLHAITPNPLPGTRGLPIQFVLTSMVSYENLYHYAETLLADARQSGLFMFINSDLRFNSPQYDLKVDRNLAGQLGVSMQAIANALSVALNENYSSRFSMYSQSYEIIAQLPKPNRRHIEQVLNINIKTANGQMIPLSTLVTVKHSVQPPSLNQFQQLNAITISGLMMPGVTLGDALDYLQTKAHQLLPKTVNYDYQGMSRQFRQEGDTLAMAFIFACVIIFLVLAAQFESFSDPLIILISVPMSLLGALLALKLFGFSLNIYSQIGLLSLIGLISKAGILLVEFANKMRDEDQSLTRLDAIQQAAVLRLRPILMTTFSMIVGVMPLIWAAGPGAGSREVLGVVIASGMAIGTLFTLFVVPVFYVLLAREHRHHDSTLDLDDEE